MVKTNITMNRRIFLSGSVSAIGILALPTSTYFIAAERAKAEPVTTVIIAAVAIAGAISSLTAKGDGTRNLFAILNAKLDQIVELQNETIKAIGIVSKQVEALRQQVPEMLVSESFRQQLVKISSFSSRLLRLTDRANSDGWTKQDTNILDQMIADVWVLVSDIRANLHNSSAGNEVGLDMVRHAMPTLYAAYQLVPAFAALDKEIGLKDERRKLHGNIYQDIIRDTREAIEVFSSKHLIQQKKYQDSKLVEQKNLLGSSPFSQWQMHLESMVDDQSDEKSVAFSANTKFGTSSAFGPCTHGKQSDDVKWAIKVGQDASKYSFHRDSDTWTTYDLYVSAKVVGEAYYNKGARAGFRDISIELGEANAVSLGSTRHSNLSKAKRRSQSLSEGFAHTFYPTKEYYCPGVAANDRKNKAQAHIVSSRDALMSPVEIFRKANLDFTEHLWNGIGIDEMIKWAMQVDEDMREMENSV